MSSDSRDRFGLSHHPFNKRFLHQHPFETAATMRLQERFRWLSSERGLGILTQRPCSSSTKSLMTTVTDPAVREIQETLRNAAGDDADSTFPASAPEQAVDHI